MRKLRALWIRMRGIFGIHKEDFSAELESHLQLHIEDNLRRGMTSEEARRDALIQLGGMEQTKQAYRERESLPWIETLWQDIRFGLRMLWKNPGFTTTAVLTLALGIGANNAIFSVVKAVLLAPLPYKNADRIVAVWTANPIRGNHGHPSTPGDFAIWQKSGIFEDLAPSYDDEKTLTGQGSPQFLIGYAVSANYLRILDVQPKLGRLFTNEEDKPGGPKVVLLSNRLWRATFNSDPDIVGKAITLDGKPYMVLGVMPPAFNYPPSVDVWNPVAMAPSDFDDFTHPYVRILGRLRSGITLEAAQKEINALEARTAVAHPSTDNGNRVILTPIREQLDGDIRRPLLILLGAVGLVLLIACANTAGLALARNAERQKEISVRLALGATRLRLLRQFVTESMLLAIMGGVTGLLLAFAGTRFLLTLFPNDVSNLSIPKIMEIPIDRGVLLFALGITLLSAFLFGVLPVLKVTCAEAGDAMKESGRSNTASRRSNRSRSTIVVTEVAISLILLTAAGLVVASFQRVMNADLGFQPDGVLALQAFLPIDRYPLKDGEKTRALVNEAINKMSTLPGVKSAGATNFLPLIGFWGTSNFLLRGQVPPKDGQLPEADNRVMTPGYMETMSIPLVHGRAFTDADRADAAHVAMINQTFARQYFKDKDPIGEELNLGTADKPDWWRIVGISGDVKSFGQDQPTHAEIYRPFDQVPFPIVAFTLRTEADPVTMIKPAEQALWTVDPDLPVFKAIPMDALANQSLALRRASSALISGFAVLALLLACIGIYGVMAYAVTQRTQEIGVRMALGAGRADVLRLMMGRGFRLIVAGILIGLAGALASARLLSSLLFETAAINPLIFSLAAVSLVAVAILASYLPARRGASINPVQALRTE